METKKLLFIILLLVTLFSFASCNQENSTSDTPPKTLPSTSTNHVDDTLSPPKTNTDISILPDTSSSIEPTLDYDDWLDTIYTFNSVANGYTITKYKGNEKIIDIPKEYRGELVVGISQGAFSNTNITFVSLPNTINFIGNNAFENSTLEGIWLPLALVEIGEKAFFNTGLIEIAIPPFVETIGNSAFANCKSLQTVQYNPVNCREDWMTYKTVLYTQVSSWYPVFSGCDKLNNIIIGESVEKIPPLLFSFLSNLQEVTIPENVKSIGLGAFYGCENLKKVNYNAIDATTVYTQTFRSPYNADGEQFPIFGNCSVSEVNFGEFVKKVPDRLFYKCYDITYVCFPDNVTNIERSALLDCINIEELVVGYGVETIDCVWAHEVRNAYGEGNIILGAPNIIKAELKGVKTFAYDTIQNNSVIETLILGSIEHIEKEAFLGCKSLSNLSLSDTILTIGENNLSNCKLLEYNFYENGKYLGNETNPYAYYVGYIEVKDSYVLHPNTKTIGYKAFYNCQSLKEITLPEGLQSIAEQAFANCNNIKSIDLSVKLKFLGKSAFSNCTNLKIVNFSGNNITTINEKAFLKTAIESITIPDGVVTIESDAFSYCEKLSTITIPPSLSRIDDIDYVEIKRVYITSIEGWCKLNGISSLGTNYSLYLNGESLTKIVIPEGVTRIENNAFQGIKTLTEVTIPKSVTSIGDLAFGNCNNLIKINYNGTKLEWSKIQLLDHDWIQDWDYNTGEYIIYCTNGKIAK